MPELPEVEIVKQSLLKNINNKIIKNVKIYNSNLRFKVPINLAAILKGSKIKYISRFSKYIILLLDNKFFVVIHLGMSGTIHIIKKGKKNTFTNLSFYHSKTLPKKHNHIVIFFNNIKIVYNDPRRFGYFKIFANRYELDKFFENYGPEPFDKKFDVNYLKNKFNKKKKNIKNYLLDQKFVSGIGNIYANEILFFCKLNPLKKSGKLINADYKNLIQFSKTVLKKAIKRGGSSIRNFKDTNGKLGTFQDNFRVYQRENMRCLRKYCNGTIKKKILFNRSLFYCNTCQK